MVRRYLYPPKTAMGKRRFHILRYLSRSSSGCRKTGQIALVCKTSNETVLNHLHWLQANGYVTRVDRITWALAPQFKLSFQFDFSALESGGENAG
jgi:hypothetical protein